MCCLDFLFYIFGFFCFQTIYDCRDPTILTIDFLAKKKRSIRGSIIFFVVLLLSSYV